MDKKNELKLEELEQVNGGGLFNSIQEIHWRFNVGDQVYVKLEDRVTLVEGRVTKRGYDYTSWLKMYGDNYYIECPTATYLNGWYMGGSYWNGNVTLSSGKPNWTVITPID